MVEHGKRNFVGIILSMIKHQILFMWMNRNDYEKKNHYLKKNAHSSMKLLYPCVNKFMPRVENFRLNLEKKIES